MINKKKNIDVNLFSNLVCPLSRTNLRFNHDSHELVSEASALAFPIRNGIPILLIDEARKTD